MKKFGWKPAALVGLVAVIIVLAVALIVTGRDAEPSDDLPGIIVPSVQPATPVPQPSAQPTPEDTKPPAPERVTLIGDSIMVAAENALYEYIPNCVVNAKQGRQLVEAMDILYDMEAAGEIDPDTRIAGMTLDQCHYYSLEFSNNEISEAMLDYLGGYSQYKRDILKYIGDAAEDVTNDYYYDNAFTAEMVLNILDYLYEHSNLVEEQIGHMLLAQPDEYLESGELDCDIAQKYGYETYDGALHVAVAGIVYAEEPFLITVLTRYNYGAVYAMGELCDAFAAWDAERISALRQDSNGDPAQITDPEEQAEENELEYLRSAARSAILAAAQAACAVSPLPSLLPWDEIFGALNI